MFRVKKNDEENMPYYMPRNSTFLPSNFHYYCPIKFPIRKWVIKI